MELTIDELTEQALRLPAEFRAQLADQLAESLADVQGDQTWALWAAEAVRRRDEVRSGKVQGIPGEQVVAEARQVVGR
jgi:putative addiction module component (TIGR02574 family)